MADPDNVAELLAGRPGVYTLDRADRDPDEVQLAQAGWRVARPGPIHDLDSFYSELSDALGLPSWFGHNLDALWEVLVDLDRPTMLAMIEAESMMTERPKTWRRLIEVLTERADLPPSDGVAFALVTLDPKPDPFGPEPRGGRAVRS